MRDETWQSWWNDNLRRGTKTNGANLCRDSKFVQEESATKDDNLAVTDGVCKQYILRNGTFPAKAHSITRTRSHAVTNFSCVAQGRKAQVAVIALRIHRLPG